MEIETLKRNKLKKYGGIVLVFIAVIVTVVQLTSRAKYKTTQSIELARGTINYTVPDLNLVSMYIEDSGEYKASDTVPSNGYKLNQDKSYCAVNGNKDSSITFGYENKLVNLYGLGKKGTKCYLYFDSHACKGISCESILTNINTIKTRNDFSTTLTDATTGVIYKSLDENQYDDNGETYYFAGNPTDNWVKFGGFYWRIIRINGDGTIRMIYNGPTTDQTGETTQIGTSVFNSNYDDNMYVGFQYTSGEVHGRGTDSTIKGVLDNWYNNNLSSYSKYIATGEGASFCNDRTPSSGSGIGATVTDYAAYNRLYTNKAPTLKCTDTKDRFATTIGLITADEVAYAGGVNFSNNSGYYLYTGQYYWTMSPSSFNSGNSRAYVFYVNTGGSLGPDIVGWVAPGIRPVINLKADTQFTSGNGTSSNPYTV